MPVSPFSRLKISAEAKPVVNRVIAKVPLQQRAKVEQTLAQAAGQNADRFLSHAEASAVASAFEGSPGMLTGPGLDAALGKATTALKQMSAQSNVSGMSAHFSNTEKLETRLITELNDSVQRADGRPVEVNAMIFEFQSDAIEKEILSIAKAHPEVTFRFVADSTQASANSGNALPGLLKAKLPNIQVKFKKDFPYTWSQTLQRPVFNHSSSKGLNHHKGFATYIDGAPDRLVSGSFNWSSTANEKNYEDLMVFKGVNPSSRRAIEQFRDEFAGYFNNNEATLSPNNFANFKSGLWNGLIKERTGRINAPKAKKDDAYPEYAPAPDAKSFDLNGFRKQDRTRLDSVVGAALAKSILEEQQDFGRFASFAELFERVPGLSALPAEAQQTLRGAEFGSRTVSVNNGSAEELQAAGLTSSQAKAVVAHRERHGDFESVDGLLQVPGMTAAALKKSREVLSGHDVEVFFNSRTFGDAVGGTGYGRASSVRQTAAMNDAGQVEIGPAAISLGATDLFNRAQPGQTIRVAMYGMSTTSKEYKALVAAARRGAAVRVVLNKDYTAPTVAALKALAAEGLPVEVRVQRTKTMHEKFGLVGDDVFAGSANFSESSSAKHSEERFAVKNNQELAETFEAQFETLWAKSR